MASFATPPMPQRPGAAAPSAPDLPPSAESLVGPSTTPSNTRSQPDDVNRQFVALLREVHDRMEDLARMQPQMASFVRRAQDALTKGMVATVGRSNPGGQQPRGAGVNAVV